ncbi:uncharacterized protein [Rutidosis leptorrhynchoides]|uniref:uncharacterized protein isoform X2 n=1 Tax=Rutidosis leptorrhynchoides TaxID=125765 RepID=UPI003A99F4BC
MVAVALCVGFVIGALVVIGVEVLGVLYFIQKLSKKANKEEIKVANSELSKKDELHFTYPNKQGWVWILENEKIPKITPLTDKNLHQQKRKTEIVEVSPVRKQASIKDQFLHITEPDGSLKRIPLLGCIVEAVSATNLPSRKWAKKYPIKVENKSSVLYNGNKLFYMYFETSCEKESWCKALRIASCEDKAKLKWFHSSRSEFHSYLASLNVEYPSFLKPSIGFNPEMGDKSIKIDGSSSKVRHFLKKLAKKTSKTGKEDKKIIESSVGGSVKPSQIVKKSSYGAEEIIQALTPRLNDTDSNDKITSDEGTLCCNLLISRLFFDAKNNLDLRKSIQARIQRTLSTIRTPSYIGEVICTGVETGNIPPYIHGMRVLPSDLKEVVAMEIDIEYYGGAVLDIETRLEVQELQNPDTNSDSTSVDEVKTDLLEGFEQYGEQLKLDKQKNHTLEHKEEAKSFKGSEQGSSSTVPKWKSVLNSVAKQVSQVPLSLAIRVTTLRGTLRVHIKPPPSDQIWFGFTSMPEIDFSLESSVGDHKITSGHIALFIISKFKAAIRESMVLPNSESVTIPFMLAEKNDWVPQKVAPFIWNSHELTTDPISEPNTVQEVNRAPSSQDFHTQEPQEGSSSSKRSTENTQDVSHDKKPINQVDDKKFTVDENSSDEKTPLLASEEQQQSQPQPQEVSIVARNVVEENREVSFPNWQQPSPPQAMMSSSEESNETVEGDEARLRRLGTKAKMLGLRKKMGEKLEEKRRNIEEKGRHIVEKMRGPGGI